MGLRVGRFDGDLKPVDEFHTPDDFWQLVVAVETAPTLLCALNQLEHRGERGLVREASLRTEADQFLLVLRRGADDDEDALRVVLQTRLQIDAVGADVDLAFGRQDFRVWPERFNALA